MIRDAREVSDKELRREGESPSYCEGHPIADVQNNTIEPMSKTKKWLYIRIAIVGMFVSSAPALSRSIPDDDLPPLLLILVLGYSYLSSMFCLQWLHRRNSRVQNWERPTCFTDPFSGAAHFFHLGSFCFMGIGFLSTILTALKGQNFILPAISAVFGLGMCFGIRRFFHKLEAGVQ